MKHTRTGEKFENKCITDVCVALPDVFDGTVDPPVRLYCKHTPVLLNWDRRPRILLCTWMISTLPHLCGKTNSIWSVRSLWPVCIFWEIVFIIATPSADNTHTCHIYHQWWRREIIMDKMICLYLTTLCGVSLRPLLRLASKAISVSRYIIWITTSAVGTFIYTLCLHCDQISVCRLLHQPVSSNWKTSTHFPKITTPFFCCQHFPHAGIHLHLPSYDWDPYVVWQKAFKSQCSACIYTLR